MHLETLELQGFKTFAQKSTLEFLSPRGGTRGITAIVGPNGSGKSNLADAVRWVLGEQSLKLLRGKKSEDVIFSGTEKRGRAGFAEVSLTLNNEDRGAPIDYTTLVITRRLYRDGESQYLVNGKPVRLGDIQLLLAQANFGQRTYSVIGQGMVDHVLVASPQERKEFFDEAAGVKQFQIKRNQAAHKLEATRENLAQAETLLHEIEPRLRSLSRQIRRLEERGPLEEEMHALGRAYYGTLWVELEGALGNVRARANEITVRRTKKTQELAKLRAELEAIEKEETRAAGYLALQKEYGSQITERNRAREELFKLQHELHLATLTATTGAGLPLPRIVHDLERVVEKQKKILGELDRIQSLEELASIRQNLREVTEAAASLLRDLTGGENARAAAPELQSTAARVEKELSAIDGRLNELEARIKNYASEEQKQKGRFFTIQRTWEERQTELASIDHELNEANIRRAKLETQRDALAHEVELELGKKISEITAGDIPELTLPREAALERVRKLKTQLEFIGGIDPETIKEHAETKERHDFLKTHIDDLGRAVEDLGDGIAELDRHIEERAEAAFKTINQEFGTYFKQLFGGGHAVLVKTEAEKDEDENDAEETLTTEPVTEKKKKKEYAGIEIQATPPGKRLKAINMLSGGERALTSIALICAIMAANPSPFVVLDEVDAALDESNSIRFAGIIDELAARTQFIIITHNRATMHTANILYGVTMGDDGVSRLLSLKLEEAEAIRGENKMTV
ncbi:AAA family ATPase [Candidatus Uhrbacteria bacterium]|nr:AAA family ATPase [Candidatus Uhrbacteria bacterium]